MHRCPINGANGEQCDTQVADDMLTCRHHWRLCPQPERHALYRAWRRGNGAGTNAHRQAMQACIRAIEHALAERQHAHIAGAPRLPGL